MVCWYCREIESAPDEASGGALCFGAPVKHSESRRVGTGSKKGRRAAVCRIYGI
nr:MAG TPA: hypothetical protein [Caudoviricetes sp.]